MPTLTAVPLHFSALRRFDIELGAGAIVAVFFGPGMPRRAKCAAGCTDQDNFDDQPGELAPAVATSNLIPLRAAGALRTARGLTIG